MLLGNLSGLLAFASFQRLSLNGFSAVLCGALTLLVSSVWGQAEAWQGFHGLERQGVAVECHAPVTWSTASNILWRTSIPGIGFSSPIVIADRVYLTSAYETTKGSLWKRLLTYGTMALSILVLGTSARWLLRGLRQDQTPRLVWDASTVVLVSGLTITALGVAWVANEVFALPQSAHRSWKVGVLATAFTICLTGLLSRPSITNKLLVLGAGVLASIGGYALMPKKELFLKWNSSDGLISTAIVFAPAMVATVLANAALLRRVPWLSRHAGDPPVVVAAWRRLALYCGVPIVGVAGVFAVLIIRVLRSDRTEISWDLPVICTGLVVSVLGIVAFGVAQLVLVKSSSRIKRYLIETPGLVFPLVLACGFFVRFCCLPAQTEIAYAVISVDGRSGRLEWLREVARTPKGNDFKAKNSMATPTPAAESNSLCAYFGSAGLFGLTLDGALKWRADVEYESPYGVGHSPIVAGGLVILASNSESALGAGSQATSEIAAYSLSDGKRLWQHRMTCSKASYSTPIILQTAGHKAVIARGWDDLRAYDLQTGRLIWEHSLRHRGHHLVSSLVVDDKRLYLSDSTRIMAFEPPDRAGSNGPVVWSVPIPGEKASTGIVTEDLLFVATETGLIACIDVQKGELAWKDKVHGKFYSSVLAFGDHVLFTSESGDAWVYHRGPRRELVARNSFGEKTYATPVPNKHSILFRTENALYCIGAKTFGP